MSALAVKLLHRCIWPNVTHHAPLPSGVRAPAWSECFHCGKRVWVRGLYRNLSTPALRRWWARLEEVTR